MAEPIKNPFENEKPKLAHFEKNESHYEYCRTQMRELDAIHKRTFICNMFLCMIVCLFGVFRKYITGFSILIPWYDITTPGAILAAGIFQIFIAMVVMLFGYLAWANFRTLNIFLLAWYGIVIFLAVYHVDYLSGLIGSVGLCFYFFSLRAMQREEVLAQMEGYPDFQETLNISKSDIVLQTLLAHKGERREKSTLFTTDYSLRRKKKKKSAESEQSDALKALTDELQKYGVKAVGAEAPRENEKSPEAMAKNHAHADGPVTGMDDIAAEAPAEQKTGETSAEAAPAEEVSAQPEPVKAPAEKAPAPKNGGSGNRNGGKKKKGGKKHR